jgi:hypothetical protein
LWESWRYALFGREMADAKSRARIERMIAGNFRPDDLMHLFLYARDHCDGREAVVDVGDFIAHHSERDKGLITRSTREWFAVARFHWATYNPGQPRQIDGQKMPPATRDYFLIAVNRIDPASIRKATGLNRSNASQSMNQLAERLTKNADGTWALPADLSGTEQSLVECVVSLMVVRGAFEPDRLFDDFLATLKSNGLITKEEIRRYRDDLHALVQLYAVSVMHNCVIQIGDGTTTQLKARAEVGSNEIAVNAAVPMVNMPGVFLSASMFTAKLDPNIHCHPDLLAQRDWNFEIEVAPDKRLSPLR